MVVRYDFYYLKFINFVYLFSNTKRLEIISFVYLLRSDNIVNILKNSLLFTIKLLIWYKYYLVFKFKKIKNNMVIEKKSSGSQVLTIIGTLAIISILAVVVVLVLMFNNREGYKNIVLYYKLIIFCMLYSV